MNPKRTAPEHRGQTGEARPLILFVLLLVMAGGGLLRFWNLNWDGGHLYHPDSMNIAMAVARIEFFGNMDPQFHAYNGLAVYLYKLLGEAVAAATGNPAWSRDLGHIVLLGRYVSATLATVSIALLYKAGRRFAGPGAGLLTAFLAAFSTGLVQTAHYAVTETMLVFFLLLLTLRAAQAVEAPEQRRHWLLMGVAGGLALGTKTTALSFGLVPVGVLLVSAAGLGREEPTAGPAERSRGPLLHFLLCCAVWALVAAAVSPYTLIDFDGFLQVMAYESGIAKGTVDVPYTLQFARTQPYWFHLQNLLWHLGPVVPFLGLSGCTWWTLEILGRKRSPAGIPLLLFTLVFISYVGAWHAKFVRNLVPIYPALLLGSGLALSAMIRTLRGKPRALAVGATGAVLLCSLLWCLAFCSIYGRESTRTAASAWIYRNIPAGAHIIRESWDYALPGPVEGVAHRSYRFKMIDAPAADREKKFRKLVDTLRWGDYLILASRRNYGNLPALPDRYPLMDRFYATLFGGRLGYTETKRFASYPQLFGLSINDSGAEETFRVFDHPTVILFENTGELDREAIEEVLSGWR
ncbi:MAG: glycosyltransferase family 39 protein [Synergistales bacterium]|nr:glycosyltransferase family 39 protein [Synergistales bacterium]